MWLNSPMFIHKPTGYRFEFCYCHKNNRLEILVPTFNDKFILSDESYYLSDIQNYFCFFP